MIWNLVELNNYLIMSKLADLGASLIMVSASLYPLLDIIHSGGDIEHGVSTLTLGLILILLIIVLLLGMLLFYFTWVDIIDEKKYD